MTTFNIDKEKSYKASKVSPTKFILKYGLLYVAFFWMLFIGKTLALETSYAVGVFIFIVLTTVLGERLIMSKLLYRKLNNQYVELTSEELIRYDGDRKLGSVFLDHVVAVEEEKDGLHVKTQDNTSIVIPGIFSGYDEIKQALWNRVQA